jgi:ribosomal protein S18 acetylase RimI-like enzyme
MDNHASPIVIEPMSSNITRDYRFEGFFEGWRFDPGPDGLIAILQGSYRAVVALDPAAQRVVGFVNCVSDGVLSAFIPLLEVLPDSRGRGIAGRLMRDLLADLDDFYSVDIVCDDALIPFYEELTFERCAAMIRRNYGWSRSKRLP